jgi:hypothetical protein
MELQEEYDLLCEFWRCWESYNKSKNGSSIIIIPMETNFYHHREEILGDALLLEQLKLNAVHPEEDADLHIIIGYCIKQNKSVWFQSIMKTTRYEVVDGDTWMIVDHFFAIPRNERQFYCLSFHQVDGDSRIENYFLHERPWIDQSPLVPYNMVIGPQGEQQQQPEQEQQQSEGCFDEYMVSDFNWDEIDWDELVSRQNCELHLGNQSTI